MTFRNLQRSGAGGGGAGDIEGVTAGSGLTGGGVSGTVSLAVDHATATPAAPGTAAVGVATKSAREDHVHAPLVRKLYTFMISAAAANATTAGNVSAGDTNYPGCTVMRAGTITGIAVRVNGNPGGSTAQVRATINSAANAALSCAVPAGSTRAFTALGVGATVAADDLLCAAIVTDASWTSTTLKLVVDIEVTETA